MAEFNQETEKLLIEALISNGQLYARCQSILDPKYFHVQYQKVVKFIHGFCEEYKALPTPEQVYAKTGVELEKVDMSPEHEKFFMDEIEGFCRHKALTQAVLEGVDLIEKGEYNAVEKLVKEAILVGLQKDLGTDYYADPRARLIKLKESNGDLSTGWKSVDQKLYNVGRGELIIFAAPSGGGKSVALQNLTVNMSMEGHHCIYVTLELSEELCAKRMDSMVSGIASAEVYRKLDDVELEVKRAGMRSGKITIKKFPSGITTRDLRTYLREWMIKHGVTPTMIAVDYLDLMMPNDKRVSPADLFIKDKFVSEELRNLGEEFKVLVASASQLNRSAADALEFDHSMIGGGLSKIQTADNVIGIFNSARARERGEIEFQYMKTRNSGSVSQKTVLAYDIDTLRIMDLDEGSQQTRETSSSVLDKIQKARKNQNPGSKEEQEQEEKETAAEPPISREAVVDRKQQNLNLRDLINKSKK